MTPTTTPTAIKALSVASALSHIKNNRIEYLIGTCLLHLLGATEIAYSHVQGVCF